ncbi:MAG: NAD-dependent epimerase/dehydratase family protein [Planctomycetota bacterium]
MDGYTVAPPLAEKIRRLQGPILILGGSGFVGASLFRVLAAVRQDVYATATRLPAWRLEGVAAAQVKVADLLVDSNLDRLLDEVRPRTVFDCVAYGGYSFQEDSGLIYATNFDFVTRLVPRLIARGVDRYVHAGSSSEYGDNSAGPAETAPAAPNSDYAVSKVAAAQFLSMVGRKRRFPCCNLRLYSVYGPLEDASRLMPTLVARCLEGGLPEFVRPDVSRDFLYVDDASEAFVDAALNLREEDYGESFNVGTGRKTTIGELASGAKQEFGVTAEPVFTMPDRRWDVEEWYASADRARERLGWEPRTDLRTGLRRMAEWYRSLPDKERYRRASKQYGLDTRHSVTAIVACYKDNLAIPIMVERLTAVFARLHVDYEIILVNDCSPDDTEEVIARLSRDDHRVIGISHSRNFGSQAAFRSGMELASKNACVLLDGDLQDPPELIEQFVATWREGYDVVYGRRVKREATPFMQVAYKAFYRVFDWFSYVRIPHDAGDFSLLDRRVVDVLLQFPERDLFLRGLRAFAGFRQAGVDYVRPERMFGTTTNSLVRNLGWAKKGILSFSNVPLTMLSVSGAVLLVASVGLAVFQLAYRVLYPAGTPSGLTTVLLLILFFGAINLFAVGLVGEYIAKIFEEVKRRPVFIRRSIIRDGEIRPAAPGIGAATDQAGARVSS